MSAKKPGFLGRMLNNMTKRIRRGRGSVRVQPEEAALDTEEAVLDTEAAQNKLNRHLNLRNEVAQRTTPRTRKSTTPPTRKSTTQRTRKSTNPDVIRAVENIDKLFNNQRNLKAVLKRRLANEEANSKIRTANIKTRGARSAAIVRQLENMNQISEADYDKAKIEMDKLLADTIRDVRYETEKAQRMMARMKISEGGNNSKRSKKIRKYKKI